jgi:hypothetical protein
MTVLSNAERIEIWSHSMRQGHQLSISKTELKAAIDAVDDWVDSNAVSYNNALPVAARTNLTVNQKAGILAYVAAKRAGILN